MESDPTTMIHTAPAEIGQAHRPTTGPRPTVPDGPDSTCAPHPSLGPDNAPPSVGGNGRGVVAGAVNRSANGAWEGAELSWLRRVDDRARSAARRRVARSPVPVAGRSGGA